MDETRDTIAPRQLMPADAASPERSEPPGEANLPALPPDPAGANTGGDGSRTWDSPSEAALPSSARTWDRELPRWLAALNPGRTRREYEKAVRYFFQTQGVPPELDALTIDLLLAYRGALALRATPHVDAPPPPPRSHVAPRGPYLFSENATPELGATVGRSLTVRDATRNQEEEEGAEEGDHARGTCENEPEHEATVGPLAPATVNVRLTALRQFLTHCALFGVVPELPPERIRAALRRLRVERRRPYQVLAEPEWESFLAAARQPAEEARRSPWGRPPRAGNVAAEASAPRTTDTPTEAKRGARLTGARTAERDHALIALALATGLRAIELAALDVGDLTREWHAGQEEWWLVLPDAKTKGQRGGRTLPLAPETVESLRRYLRATGRQWERAADRATPLFLSDRKGTRRLTPSSIGRVVDRVERQWQAQHGAGDARRISPHALRHSTAIALLEGNERAGRPPASVEHVRGWLGHFDIRTTQGYLAHLDARRHRRPFALAPRMAGTADATAPEGGDTSAGRQSSPSEPPDRAFDGTDQEE